MRLLRKIILLLVFILIIPFCYAQNCIDPDGGQNYYQKSCVTFYGIENYYCDRCINSNILLEAYCEGDNLIFKKYDCPLNSCVDGTCTSTTTTSTTTTTRTTTTTTTTTSTTTTTISTTTITVEECYLNNVNIDTFHCSGAEGTCCAGDRIDVTAYYSGSCPLSAYLQLDIADNELNYDGSGCEVYDSSPIVDQFCNGLADIDGLGFVVTCSGGTCIGSTQLPSGTYAVPVPDCRGVRIDTGGAGLYKDGFPCQEDNPVSNYAWTNSISGSISFGIDLQCGAILTTTTTTIMTTTTRTTTTTSSTTTTVLLAPPTSTTARTSTTIQTTTTTSTTTTTNPTISKTGDIALSCEVSPNHSCSEKKDSYPGFPDIEEMDFSIPDSANCEDNIEVTVEWAGWHGYKDDNIDECTPNYWAVFLETSTGSYSLLGSCQSFNESDCVLWDPNTYTMSFDVKMPNKDSIVDGTYNIFVTGETDSGYCNPDESNVDIKLSKPINLMNCGSVSSSTTTTSTATTTLGSTNTTIITTIPISGFTTSTTTITHSTCTGTNIYACYETDQERCELKACCYWSNGKCGRLPCDQLSESECSKCTGCQSESEGSKTTTTISEPPLKSTTTTEGGGCPILKTWNGEKFIDVEKLNIHSKEGIDTTYSTKFDMKPINGEYKIILSEMWYALLEGSHIDHVKLIDKEGKECKLISAEHSKNGDVLSTIAKSDDIRVETRPGEDIELVFDGCSGNEFAFTIEGYNSQPAEMKEALSPTNIMAILITIALLIVIIFGIMKFSRNKSVEPKQKYDEEDSEQPFY